MTDRGDWWGPSPSSDPPAGGWSSSPFTTPPRPTVPAQPGRIYRLLAALIAGAAALTVALVGGTVIVNAHERPLALYGGPDATAAHGPGSTGSAGSSRAQPPDPVLTVQQVADRVNPGVVLINSELGYQNAEAAGTGMVLSADGVVLTNNHVIAGATSIRVTVSNTQQHYTAVVLGTAVSNDIAVLQLEGASGLTPVPLGDSSTVSTGQSVVAIGNTGGHGSLTVVSGTVTSTDRSITASDQNGTSSEQLSGMIEVKANIEAGDSGGPLASRGGKVIGMDTAASPSRERLGGGMTFGFAIPINRAIEISNAIRRGDSSGGAIIGGRGFLGIQVRSSDAFGNVGGAEVIATTANSPAEAAGIRAGDIITELDGEPVTSADGLTQSLMETKPGQQVTVGWIDSFGQSRSAPVTLSNGPAD